MFLSSLLAPNILVIITLNHPIRRKIGQPRLWNLIPSSFERMLQRSYIVRRGMYDVPQAGFQTLPHQSHDSISILLNKNKTM